MAMTPRKKAATRRRQTRPTAQRGQGDFVDVGHAAALQPRKFESADTHRLNSAHWTYATDESVNSWLSSQLSIIRARAHYECRQNGILAGMIGTHADDIVGSDGPTLQVMSDNDAYNKSLESLWNTWFAAPTPKKNISGASVLKLWIRSLWKSGEFLAQIVTDKQAEGPVKLRIKPIAPRRLGSPGSLAGDPRTFMGIQFDQLDRPTRYWIADSSIAASWLTTYTPIPADLIIHEFITEEEDQGRGIPWLNTSLQPSADLRDYDTDVQHAARFLANQQGILCTEHPDAVLDDSTLTEYEMEPGTLKTAASGYKPYFPPSVQPPVQYPDYRAERQREFGRPVGMPLMMIRLDCAKYNYSSARLETQNYYRAVAGIQSWLSGTEKSTGTLSRLVDELAKEARFSIPALRNRPPIVMYHWTWPSRPHVDPTKESNAEETALTTRTITLTDALAARGRDLETHIEIMRREEEAFINAGLTPPEWMRGTSPAASSDSQSEDDDAEKDEESESEAEDEEVTVDE